MWGIVLVETLLSLSISCLLADFSADVGEDNLEFMEEIQGISEARKDGERFCSPELMASTLCSPSFPLGGEYVP